jgi:hypothetical protein
MTSDFTLVRSENSGGEIFLSAMVDHIVQVTTGSVLLSLFWSSTHSNEFPSAGRAPHVLNSSLPTLHEQKSPQSTAYWQEIFLNKHIIFLAGNTHSVKIIILSITRATGISSDGTRIINLTGSRAL